MPLDSAPPPLRAAHPAIERASSRPGKALEGGDEGVIVSIGVAAELQARGKDA
jgi:hypothetical protein